MPSQSTRAPAAPPTSAIRSPSTTPCARRSACGTSRRCRSGCSRAPTRSPPPTTASRATWPRSQVGQVRYGAFCDERGRMLGDGTVYNTGDNDAGILVVTALSTDGDHFRRAIADQGLDAEVVERTAEMPHLQLQGPKSRELLASLTDADIASLRYFRFLEDVTIGGVPGLPRLAHGLLGRARLRDLHLARERRAPLERAARSRPVARHPPLRPRRGGVAAHRVGPDLPRLRLLPGLHLAVPHEPRSHDQARQARLPRQGRARGRARGGDHASHGDDRDRGRGGPRLQHAGLPPRPRGRAPALAQRRALADASTA